ncbi:MAG: winged helix-turn-helix domain-containing protein [Rubrivivax sp.]
MPLPERIAFADFVLLPAEKRLLRADGSPLPLSPRLYGALCLFVEHAGRLLDRETLMRALWPGLVVEENNLNQVIAGLRRALGDDAQHPRLIETVPRYGFRFVAPVQALPAAAPAAPPAVPAAAAPMAAPPSPPSARRHWLAAAAGAAALVAGGAAWWQHQAAGPEESTAAPAAQRLAVLPFKPLGSGEGRDELLEIGMADSLAARLSALPGLAVRSAASAQRYGGAAQDPLRAARELAVDWIVDGTLQRRGEQIRATARLLRAADGVAAWSGSFDARAGGVFDVQDQIAERVQQALAPVLGQRAAGPGLRAEAGGTRHPEAYQLYLTANWRAQGGRPEAIRRAIELLQQALALDPGYALAWTALAWAHRRRLWNAEAPPAEVFDAAGQALQRALALAPALPQAHAGMGFTLAWYEFDWPAAQAAFRHALQLNENTVDAHHGMATQLLTQGRIDEGWRHLQRVRELDPMSPVFITLEASCLIDRGALDEAARRLDIALDLAPQLWLTHVAQGLLLLRRRQQQPAIAALRRAVELGPGTSRPKAVLAQQLALLGQATEARAILAGLQRQAAVAYVAPTSLAMVLAALGDTAAALDALEEAHRLRDARLSFLKDDPSWRSLYGQPRFAALKQRLRLDGLPPGLTPV